MKSQSPLMHMPDDNFFTEFAGRNIGISDNQLIKIFDRCAVYDGVAVEKRPRVGTTTITGRNAK
jgi:hypothetical protein